MSKHFVMTAAALATVLAVSSGLAMAGDKAKGPGYDIAPGQMENPGKSTAPGQTGANPEHPATTGSLASDCAKIADPQKKDDCVKAAKAK